MQARTMRDRTTGTGLMRIAALGAALAGLAGCGGASNSTVATNEEVMIQKGTYVYDPDRRHAPVSLSGADIIGLEPR